MVFKLKLFSPKGKGGVDNEPRQVVPSAPRSERSRAALKPGDTVVVKVNEQGYVTRKDLADAGIPVTTNADLENYQLRDSQGRRPRGIVW